MSVKLMAWAWETSLPASEKMVLLCLCDHANDEGHCWPSVARLAKKCSVSDRTVQRSIKKLCDMQILDLIEEPGKLHHFVINPRHTVTPDTQSPPTNATEPPTQCRETPDTVSPKPSRNHQEPSKGSASGDAPLTANEVVEGWNDMAGRCGLPKVERLNAERKRKLQSRLREYDLPEWQRAFKAIERSEFLRGKNDRGWRADFDFLLSPTKFLKLLEGQYV